MPKAPKAVQLFEDIERYFEIKESRTWRTAYLDVYGESPEQDITLEILNKQKEDMLVLKMKICGALNILFNKI